MNKVVKIIIGFVVFFVSHSLLYSQAVTWTKYYDPSISRDFGIDAIQTFDGGYMLLANSNNGFYFIKINSFGDILWQKIIYSGSSLKFLQTQDSGFAVCGVSFDSRMFLLKTNKYGDTIWTKQYTIGGRLSRAYSLKLTNDKGFILCGTVNPNPPNEAYIVKTDSVGVMKWENTYSTFSALDVIESKDGNFYAVGNSILRKIDTSGKELWSIPTGYALKISVSKEGFLYLAGGSPQMYFAKYDSSGKSIFQNNFFNRTRANAMIIDEQGNFLLAGAIVTVDSVENLNAIYAKFTPDGELIFSKVINTKGLFNDLLFSANITNDGGYIMAGNTEFPIGGLFGDNVLVIKTDSAGNTSPIVNIKNYSVEFVKDFELQQNYPNPFNSTSVIEYSIKSFVQFSLYISDTNGKTVLNLLNTKQNIGTYKYFFNGSNLPSGIYFINLQSENSRAVKKMLLIK